MAKATAQKQTQALKNKTAAEAYWSRNGTTVFTLEGFKSNEPIPSAGSIQGMIERNAQKTQSTRRL